ncbi:MAG: protein translocase subunit SecF [Gammaproteobacteria bacterium]|nr:protein translocase subunit SecF [Gammaproteobacteria bacterium]
MHTLNTKAHFNFMGKRKFAVALSGILLLIAIVSIFMRGMTLGIDFTGGTLIEVGYTQAAELKQIRSSLSNAGFSDAQVQYFGSARDVLIRIAPRKDLSGADMSGQVLSVLREKDAAVMMRRVEFVGPQVGEELTEQGGLAMLYALIGILIYVALRFEWRFSVGSVAALVHDVIITIGFFSLFQFEFDLTVLAAILAVIGYSLNDTIVVFDRIRENFRMMRKAMPIEVMNASINQTISRTLITSITTLLVLIALFYFGGEVIHGFSLALIVGVVVGTYSSIYVASSTTLMLGVNREDLMPPQKEEGEEGVGDQP